MRQITISIRVGEVKKTDCQQSRTSKWIDSILTDANSSKKKRHSSSVLKSKKKKSIDVTRAADFFLDSNFENRCKKRNHKMKLQESANKTLVV